MRILHGPATVNEELIFMNCFYNSPTGKLGRGIEVIMRKPGDLHRVWKLYHGELIQDFYYGKAIDI